MPMPHLVRTRPLLSTTLLLSTLLLSACLDDACNVTGPSEGEGSHSTGTAAEVLIHYDDFSRGPDAITVTSSRGGSLRVAGGTVGIFTIANLQKDDSVTFTVGGASGTCKWSGKRSLFGDLSVVIDAVEFVPGFNLPPYHFACQGW